MVNTELDQVIRINRFINRFAKLGTISDSYKENIMGSRGALPNCPDALINRMISNMVHSTDPVISLGFLVDCGLMEHSEMMYEIYNNKLAYRKLKSALEAMDVLVENKRDTKLRVFMFYCFVCFLYYDMVKARNVYEDSYHLLTSFGEFHIEYANYINVMLDYRSWNMQPNKTFNRLLDKLDHRLIMVFINVIEIIYNSRCFYKKEIITTIERKKKLRLMRQCPIKGHHIKNLGITPGRYMGEILRWAADRYEKNKDNGYSIEDELLLIKDMINDKRAFSAIG